MMNLSRFLLALFISGGMVWGRGEGVKCHVQLGMCGSECGERCEWSYVNGQGRCDMGGVCQCYYDPELRSSRINMGFYTSGCTDQQCTADCTAKLHPRALNIRGSCVSYSPWISCACLFDDVIC